MKNELKEIGFRALELGYKGASVTLAGEVLAMKGSETLRFKNIEEYKEALGLVVKKENTLESIIEEVKADFEKKANVVYSELLEKLLAQHKEAKELKTYEKSFLLYLIDVKGYGVEFARLVNCRNVGYLVENAIKVNDKKLNTLKEKIKGQVLENNLDLGLNGTIKTTEGIYRIETILAGGYNIQKFHNRYLVKKIK